MQEHIRKRVIQGANYIIENKCTMEEVARELGISETTVQIDLRERLETVNPGLKKITDEIISSNITNGKLKGGLTMAARRELEAKKIKQSVEKSTYGQKIQKLKYSIDRVELDNEELHMIQGILELSEARKNFNIDYNNRIDNIIKDKKRSGCY